MNERIPPMFQNLARPAAQSKNVPFSVSVGDIEVPWNVSKSVFRFRAPVPMVIVDVCLFAGDIISPTGAAVAIEAWKNGVYGGDLVIVPGATMFPQKIQLQRFDLIELKIVARGEGTPATVKDLWIMYSA
jgi:hypothetical protein